MTKAALVIVAISISAVHGLVVVKIIVEISGIHISAVVKTTLRAAFEAAARNCAALVGGNLLGMV